MRSVTVTALGLSSVVGAGALDHGSDALRIERLMTLIEMPGYTGPANDHVFLIDSHIGLPSSDTLGFPAQPSLSVIANPWR
jgi:hypothetical protein